MRRSTNRYRHLPTVALDQFNCAAISELDRPSADHSTRRARDTSACGRVREAANPVSSCCSSVVTSRVASGPPSDIAKTSYSVIFLQSLYGTAH